MGLLELIHDRFLLDVALLWGSHLNIHYVGWFLCVCGCFVYLGVYCFFMDGGGRFCVVQLDSRKRVSNPWWILCRGKHSVVLHHQVVNESVFCPF